MAVNHAKEQYSDVRLGFYVLVTWIAVFALYFGIDALIV